MAYPSFPGADDRTLDALLPCPGAGLQPLLANPLLIVLGRKNAQDAFHREVRDPAKLGASDFIFAGLRCLEPCGNLPAWNDVLSKPQLRHVETVDHVLRRHEQANHLACRNRQKRSLDQLVRRTELAVGARISEFPTELER